MCVALGLEKGNATGLESAGVPGAEFGQAGVFLYGLLRDTDILYHLLRLTSWTAVLAAGGINKPHPTKPFFRTVVGYNLSRMKHHTSCLRLIHA